MIVYAAQFANGPGTIRFSLRKKGGQYEVIGVFFDSPVFQQILDQAITQPKRP